MSQHGGNNHSSSNTVGMRLDSAVAALSVAAVYSRATANRRQQPRALAPSLLDDPQYPKEWGDYIGQPKAKAMLQAAAARAKANGEPMRHVLIASGEPGIGKTALAVLLAHELGVRCFTISGTPTPTQVRQLISGMRRGDLLFIDEIHRLVTGGKAKSEWLLHVLQDDCLMGPLGPERTNLGITVVGATTDASMLPEPVLDRFALKPVMERYDPEEAGYLLLDAFHRRGWSQRLPSVEDCAVLVYAADCNPRRIKQLVDQVIDSTYDPAGYSLDTVLERAGLTYDGLDRTQQRYLVLLHQAAGPMGESQLRSLLQEPRLTYQERRLADKGYITFTRSGRQLTAMGEQRARELFEEGVTL